MSARRGRAQSSGRRSARGEEPDVSFEVNRRLATPRPPLATSASVDSVTAGIIRGAFETICYEVATHLGRCASSAIINQSNERNGSIIDAHGRLAGVSVGIPQLLFISPMSVRHGLEFRAKDLDDWGPGDVFVGNDPDAGGGHLPDYNVYAPVFDDDGGSDRGAAHVLFLDGAPAVCGNAILDPLEECDDGNLSDMDFCSSVCEVISPVCGDSVIEGPETCDDGNRNPNDGCNATCTAIGANYQCPNPGQLCVRCGDGIIQPGKEACDDGNLIDDDDDGATDFPEDSACASAADTES